MDSKLIILTIGTWFLFMICAIINAIIRNEIYKPLIGDLRAHQLSTIIFIATILIITYFVFRYSQIELTTQQIYIIGTIWLLATICFEFLAGHYVFGNSWDKLLADYNILKGRIWSFVLITILFAPYISNKIMSII
jgi:hypothetical protein